MKGVLFHQDNTPAHKFLVSMTAVCDCNFQLVDHPSYSLDLAQSAYHVNMKKYLGTSIILMMASAVDDFF